jgi:hypothetical protein
MSCSAADRAVAPQSVDEEDFAHLKESSPFLRVLRMKDAYVLRGIATIGKHTFVVLHHRETKQTITVSSEEKNELGMSLIDVSGSTPLDTAVTISMGGGQFKFAYEADLLRPEIAIPGTRDTIRKDRDGRIVTSDELMKKWHGLTQDQRKAYDGWKKKLLEARPELRHSEQRFPLAHRALDAFKAGRPPPSFR